MGSNDLRSEFRKGLRAVCAGEEPPLVICLTRRGVAGEGLRRN